MTFRCWGWVVELGRCVAWPSDTGAGGPMDWHFGTLQYIATCMFWARHWHASKLPHQLRA